MFQDEAGFGRINKPHYCRCHKGIRPSVPCHHIREYRYAYGAVEPLCGESFFLILPYCNTVCMNVFLAVLSKIYPADYIVLVADGAQWHSSGGLIIPENIEMITLPPYTPEMNPIEQIWSWIRRHGFRNEVFQILENIFNCGLVQLIISYMYRCLLNICINPFAYNERPKSISSWVSM